MNYLCSQSGEVYSNVPVSETAIDLPIGIGDIINIVLLLLTFIGLIITIVQLLRSRKLNRASFVKELYLQLYQDKDLREAFYAIEWSDYTPSERLKLQGSEEEQKTDRLLSFFEIVCSMYYRKILTPDDMSPFDYEMRRVYEHPDIQNYLRFLDGWQKRQGLGKSYVNYKRYCSTNKKALLPERP